MVESHVVNSLKKFYKKQFNYVGDKLSEEEEEAIKNAIKKTQVSTNGDISKSETTKMLSEEPYTIIYDSFHEGLEPIYFWVLDFMRDQYWGTNLEVSKALDKFDASVGGGFFGDMGTRGSVMQDRAMKLMATINTVVRSVINIIYDLREFEQRLEMYDNLISGNKEKINGAKLNLKQFWMDRVDVQRGRGSINMLAQQLQFVTLRDAFMAVNNEKDVNKTDLNDRVKRILLPRIQEYLAWEKLSGSELRKRYKIERAYLKSQVDSLKLYSNWTKPYLKAAQKLNMEGSNSPDLVSTFNNMVMELSLIGKGKPEKVGDKEFYPVTEVSFNFRSIPHVAKQSQGGMHYVQGGRVELQFRGFGLEKEELKFVEENDLFEGLDLVDGMTTATLDQLKDDIDHYLREDKDEEPKEKLSMLEELYSRSTDNKEKRLIRKDMDEVRKKIREKIKGEKDRVERPGPLTGFSNDFKNLFSSKKKSSGDNEDTRTDVAKDGMKIAYVLYLVYKKTHGMFTE